jgi:transposase
MTERHRFITDARQRVASFAELCRHYGVSRTTGYKWLHRADQSGLDYLQELSRRPQTCPHATPPELVEKLVQARRHHPDWGPRKLLKLLRRQDRQHHGPPGARWRRCCAGTGWSCRAGAARIRGIPAGRSPP